MTRPNSSHTGKRRRNRSRGRKSTPPVLSAGARHALEAQIGHTFNDAELLDRAMTHASAVPGDAARWSGERLEFLGDRVLGVVVASELYRRFEQEREGGLAPRLNALVNKDACAQAARRVGLPDVILLDAAERAAGGASKPSLLADAMEALIGAVYLDAGLQAAERLIKTVWSEAFKGLGAPPQDPKSVLQELAQGIGRAAPSYQSVGREGPDHAPVFTVKVRLGDDQSATGVGPSKQDAERAAARALLTAMDVDA